VLGHVLGAVVALAEVLELDAEAAARALRPVSAAGRSAYLLAVRLGLEQRAGRRHLTSAALAVAVADVTLAHDHRRQIAAERQLDRVGPACSDSRPGVGAGAGLGQYLRQSRSPGLE